ncbi:MAG: acetyl-CoA carboxylase biotin carboxyl carrier protein [Planctomycetaceae bacterium]|jgi:acetyl-CoA carboxylase biotin carboxyl carrier protein|nr:acetyl-CoA carboxylase biotin carboxyl carrier protein [Planctomycetaceae bacterium]
MVNSSNSGNDVFDIRRIKRLIELMQKNELTELDIQQSDMRIQLKRNTPMTVIPPPTHPPIHPATPVPVMTVPAAATPAVPELNSVVQDEKNVQVIKSPMVGTFYAAPKPDAPPFVKIGDTVHADTTVCIIEAMKVYNEIQAECSGKIIAVLAKNGETVEFGKPLFRVTKDES